MRNPVRLISTPLIAALLFLAAILCSDPLSAAHSIQSQKAAETRRTTRPTSKPYTGDLSIFEDAKRAENLQINRVIDLLKIQPGSNVADIGAGSGWFTVRAARRVGTTGTVYAVEINPDYLSYIAERAADEKLSNIRTVLGKEDDPLLPRDTIDAVLILKTYHEIAQPIRLLTRLRDAMRSGALMGVIDRDGNGKDHGIRAGVVIKEAAEAGFSLVEQYDFVKPDGMDYFLVFRVGTAVPSH
ncbi:MAG: methyltransferase domain-containing protein [Acidobacteriota bacterium]